MSHDEVITLQRYCAAGVNRLIARGGESFIGLVDEATVLKYPCVLRYSRGYAVESQLLEIFGSHSRIIGSKGLTKRRSRLEYAVNGNLCVYCSTSRTLRYDKSYDGVDKLLKQWYTFTKSESFTATSAYAPSFSTRCLISSYQTSRDCISHVTGKRYWMALHEKVPSHLHRGSISILRV